ncbi:MAG: hypothetical protein ACYC7J_20700 [Syntrophales bacterium]
MAAVPACAIPLYFPHVDTNAPWQTEIAIINTSATQSVTGTLRALSNQGQLVDTEPVSLPPHGRRQITVANVFANHTSIGYIVFETNSGTVQGYTKFFIAGSYRAAIPAVKDINAGNIYVTHIDSGAEWWTGIALVNTLATAKTITITFNTGATREITLNANEHKVYEITRDFFFGQPQPLIRSAVISNAGGIIGLELFGTHDGKLLEGIPLTDRTASTLYYPHVDNVNWWTGIVAYNPSDVFSLIRITPYNAQGGELAYSDHRIDAGGSLTGPVLQLGIPSQTAWFKVTATQRLAGFELFGTTEGGQLGSYAGNGTTGTKAGVFAKIEKDGWTGLALVNTEDSPATVTLTFYRDAGTVVAGGTIPLGAHAKYLGTTRPSDATYIAFTADKKIAGFQLNGSTDGTMVDGLPILSAADDNPVGTYTGTYHEESVTLTTQWGSRSSATLGRSEDIPFTVTVQDNGQIKFSFSYGLRIAWTDYESGAINNLRYTEHESLSDKEGPYANGSFDFQSGTAHISGTYANGTVSGSIVWEYTRDYEYGTIAFRWVELFSATKQ